MNSEFILADYINTFDTEHIEDMRKKLFSLGVLTKDYPDDNLMLLYNRYNNDHKQPLELECRSIVINRDNFQIENFSCMTPIYNNDAMKYLIMNQDKEKEIFVCYEGSLLSLFNFGGKWYFSSRRNLIPVIGESNMKNPHYKMFSQVLEQDGFTPETFIEKLDNKYTYHFVLIHHENKNIVNYESQFGENYMKLCFIFAREKNTKQEINAENINSLFLSENIFLPKRMISMEKIDQINSGDLTKEPTSEGIIIKTNNRVLKLQTIPYQFYKAIGTEKNLYRGFLHLYQNNKLKNYFESNENTMKYKKIVNPLKTDESFDTMGMIDAVFKVTTKELFELFNTLWDMETGNHKNETMYNILPQEYKTMLFNVRKLYFINKKKNLENYLSMKDIYFYLKTLDIGFFESFIRSRKLMLNLVRKSKNDKDIIEFGKTTNIERKILNKLCAIYTNKMFPEIMPDDVPNMSK
jgi:hypothetical protein